MQQPELVKLPNGVWVNPKYVTEIASRQVITGPDRYTWTDVWVVANAGYGTQSHTFRGDLRDELAAIVNRQSDAVDLREQLQEDLLCVLDGQPQELLDSVCAAIVNRFKSRVSEPPEQCTLVEIRGQDSVNTWHGSFARLRPKFVNLCCESGFFTDAEAESLLDRGLAAREGDWELHLVQAND